MEAKGSLVTINIEGKPLEKLIDVVSKGIGTLYRPRQIRKEADAQAYAIKILESAKAAANSESKLIEAETDNRIAQRLVAKEVRRQENIDSVVEMAANNLANSTVSETPVEEDWASRFFDIVQDVSREEMKALWAKILAKEIEKPSSYSLRTLELLRNISYEEAELFSKLAKYVIKQSGCFVFAEDGVLERYDLKYIDLARLREAGLLQSGEMIVRTYAPSKSATIRSRMTYGDLFVQVTLPAQIHKVELPILLLTQAGSEIFELIEPTANLGYLKDMASFFRKKNPSATVQYARIVERIDSQVRYEIPMKDI